ncbi:lanthionine synthetase C family protein [Paenibacillus sp. GD4]|uniref:lanthionine synthetase C family protein n=1 Tax=Paenibacillus sp. GD4 TaxID=3068890 RepID=UPI0027969E04|nr:lanthionine synthetase C family protein [Paenibacillus sp. GD4]MDQ1914631.1 lanthionine synthetase C family protein [Paenibacillus sp. GD4]
MSWEPIVDDELRKSALGTVQAIAARLENHEMDDATISGGLAGVAVLFHYLDRAGLGDGYSAKRFLDRAMDAVAETPMSASLYEGFLGIAWAIAHLSEKSGDDDLLYEVDSLLLELLRKPWYGDFDLTNGLVGIGVYARERFPSPAAEEMLTLVIRQLDAVAEKGPHGTTWFTRPELLPPDTRSYYAPDGYYNLGMAHGAPGVIALLSHAFALGVEKSKVRRLLDDAIPWLLARRIEDHGFGQFPRCIGPGIEPSPALAAWCHGDPGVAAALLAAAKHVGESNWADTAMAICKPSVLLQDDESRVAEAGFCHGAAGLAHLYNRFYQATGEELFKEAACHWVRRTLDMRRRDQGIGGYLALTGSHGRMVWTPEPGMLIGSAGIALTLLAASTSIEPLWDRIYLLSK